MCIRDRNQLETPTQKKNEGSTGWMDELLKKYGKALDEYDKRMSDNEWQRIRQMVEKFQRDSERWIQKLRNDYKLETEEVPEDKNMEQGSPEPEDNDCLLYTSTYYYYFIK